ncbi:MAG: hypothetical protein ABI239_11435 [Aquihabitans sp.]
MTVAVDVEGADAPRTKRRLPGPRASLLLLLAIYIALSLVNDPGAYLGTDTGGKVVTLHEMTERGSPTNLDIGYWASEWDPEGTLHPYFGTRRMGDAWTQVTTIPMILVGHPLYALGGYRLVLVLPMLGGLACAAAARRMARLMGATGDGQAAAFWLVGLAGPVLIYSLDFWEHTIGLAAMAWAAIALTEATGRSRGQRLGWGLAAGLLWGFAFSMRTESLIYAAVMTATILAHRAFVGRRLKEAFETGLATVVGLLGAIAANVGVEVLVLGSSLRAGRAEATASGAGSTVSLRLREALVTTFGLGAGDLGVLLGLLAFALLVVAILGTRRPETANDRWPMLAVGASVPTVLYLLSTGFGFVPGMFATAPVAIAGLVLGRKGSGSPLVWGALFSLPMVWAFQYTGGAGPQWGGRYTLMSAFVLTVAGAAALPSMDKVIRSVLVFGSVAITMFGLVWMSVRTHHVADAAVVLRDRGDQVVVASRTAGFLPREFTPAIAERRWLMTTSDADLVRASEVVTATGDQDFAVLFVEGAELPERIGSYRRGAEEVLQFVPGANLLIVTYER